eukprot:94108_1
MEMINLLNHEPTKDELDVIKKRVCLTLGQLRVEMTRWVGEAWEELTTTTKYQKTLAVSWFTTGLTLPVNGELDTKFCDWLKHKYAGSCSMTLDEHTEKLAKTFGTLFGTGKANHNDDDDDDIEIVEKEHDFSADEDIQIIENDPINCVGFGVDEESQISEKEHADAGGLYATDPINCVSFGVDEKEHAGSIEFDEESQISEKEHADAGGLYATDPINCVSFGVDEKEHAGSIELYEESLIIIEKEHADSIGLYDDCAGFGVDENNQTIEKEHADSLALNEDESNKHYRGLRNLGTTCYQNAVMQVLVECSLESVLSSVSSLAYVQEGASQSHDEWQHDQQIANDLLTLIHELKRTDIATPVNGIFFVQNLPHPWSLVCSQQDGVEFFHFIMEIIVSLYSNSESKNDFVLDGLMRGLINQSFTCGNCGNTTNTPDPFVALNVSPSDSVRHSLHKYLSKEEAVHDYLCTICKERTTVSVTKDLMICPNIMCVALKRFQWNEITQKREKINERIKVDTEFTILSNGKTTECCYVLFAVVMHNGNAHSGHYWTLVRRDMDNDSAHSGYGRWLKANDEIVRPIPWTRVKMWLQASGHATPYFAFYYQVKAVPTSTTECAIVPVPRLTQTECAIDIDLDVSMITRQSSTNLSTTLTLPTL